MHFPKKSGKCENFVLLNVLKLTSQGKHKSQNIKNVKLTTKKVDPTY